MKAVKVAAIARREYVARVRSKGFIFTTLLVPGLMLLYSVLFPALTRADVDLIRVTVVDAGGNELSVIDGGDDVRFYLSWADIDGDGKHEVITSNNGTLSILDETLSTQVSVPIAGDGRVLVRVRDHGPGLSELQRKRLFRAFSKSARAAAETAPGVGLGLALSRRFAREMGGDLRLDASVTDGACFELELLEA